MFSESVQVLSTLSRIVSVYEGIDIPVRSAQLAVTYPNLGC